MSLSFYIFSHSISSCFHFYFRSIYLNDVKKCVLIVDMLELTFITVNGPEFQDVLEFKKFIPTQTHLIVCITLIFNIAASTSHA